MQILLNILSLASFYLCFSLGLALVFGVMRVINFAHGELYMLGAYSALLTVGHLGPVIGTTNAYIASFFIAAVVCSLLGAVIYKGIVVKLKDHPLAVFIATLAISYILQVLVAEVFGPVGQTLESPISGLIEVGGAILPWSRGVVIAAISLLTIGLWLFLTKTEAGRLVRAIAQNIQGARIQGIDVERIGLMTFIIGSSIAGICGSLMAPLTGITPYMGISVLWKAFIIIIVGGIGSIWGAVVAALLFGTLDTTLILTDEGRFQAVITAGLMLLLLCVKPSGLLGEKE